MPDTPSPSPAAKETPTRHTQVEQEIALPGYDAVLPNTPASVMRLQRAIGNRAAQRLMQRETGEPPSQGSPAAIAQRQPTAIQMSLFQVGDYVSGVAEGQIEYPDPTADPNAPSPVVSAAEFGHTFKRKAIEFSGSLMKVSNPLDETMNQWLDLGQNVKVSTSLALFKFAGDLSYKDLRVLEASMNAGEIEIALSGRFDHTTMQTTWGQRLFGGTAIGQSLAKKRIVFAGTLKLSLALPAEDALRLGMLARHHKQLRAMAYQNKFWIQKLYDQKLLRKALEKAWSEARDGYTRINLSKQLGENKAMINALTKAIRKNQRIAKSVLKEAVSLAKSFTPALKATLGKLVPIINAYLLVSDTIKAIEAIYGMISGKGYTFSLGGEEGGDGTGTDLNGGSAPEGQGVEGEGGEETAAASEDAEFAGLENMPAGGGMEVVSPGSLNPNALAVYNILIKRTSGEPSAADLDLLNSMVSSDLNAEHMERLLATLQTAKLANTPFKALTQVMQFTKQARDAVDNAPSADGTGKGQGAGDGGAQPVGGGGGEDEDIILLDEDESYGQTQAQSQSGDNVDLNANEHAPDSPNPVPAQQGQAPAPPVVDPDIKAFMARAMAAIESGQQGYAEMDNAPSYNNLAPGDVFRGMVAVLVPTTNKDGEGVVTQSDVWYGGEAQFKVLQKLGSGELLVIRSVMQAYNRYGRFVGTVGAGTMTVGYKGELNPSQK